MLGLAEYVSKILVGRQLIRQEGRGKLKNVTQSLITSMLLVQSIVEIHYFKRDSAPEQ